MTTSLSYWLTKCKVLCLLFAIFLVLLGGNPLQAQQNALILPWTPQQFTNTNGTVLANGKVCTYQAGTSTGLATYTDSTASVANSVPPNAILLDSTGRATSGGIWLKSPLAYKIVVLTAGSDNTCNTGVTIKTQDQVITGSGAGLNLNNTFTGTNTFNGATTLTGLTSNSLNLNSSGQLVGLDVNNITNGPGLQIFNTSTTCTTGASVGATCTTANVTLPVTEPDTNYRMWCMGRGFAAGVPVFLSATNVSTTQFTISIAALTAAAASFSSYDCGAGHN